MGKALYMLGKGHLLTFRVVLLCAAALALAAVAQAPWAAGATTHAGGGARGGRSASSHSAKCARARRGGRPAKSVKSPCMAKRRKVTRLGSSSRRSASKPSVPQAPGAAGANVPSGAKPGEPTPAIRSAPVVEQSPVGPAPIVEPEPSPPGAQEPPAEEPESPPPSAQEPPAEEPEPSPPSEPTSEPTPTSSEPAPSPAPGELEPAATSATSVPFRFFSSSSFWNEAVPVGALLDPGSVGMVGAFDAAIVKAQEEKKNVPSIDTTAWSVPVYTVPQSQPTVKVALEPASRSLALQAAWEAVPLPAGAHPATGTDKHLVVWQPSANKLWEFWKLEDTTAGWRASWGGAIQSVSSDPGAYGPQSWLGAKTGWGASATSLSIAGGLITLEDLQRGTIDHALAMAIPGPRGGVYASPAERTDGWSTASTSIPEGAHLRLDPNLDLASLHLPKFTLMLAQAAQRYGIFVRDAAAKVVFYGQDPTPTGTNPYQGSTGYYEGKTAQQIMAAFPWSHLQILQMELH